MKIGIDITATQDQYKNRGIGRVALKVTQGLIDLSRDKNEIILFGFEESFPKLEGRFNTIFFNKKVQKSKPQNRFYWRTSYESKVICENPDVYLSYNFERGLPIGKIKSAIFIHDIIPFISGKYSIQSPLHNYLKKRFYKYSLERAKKAEIVLAVSEYTKSEIVKEVDFDRNKIYVTYLGVEEKFKKDYESHEIQKALNRYGLKFPYILYYGGFEKNKNIPNLIKSWEIFLNKNPLSETKLVIVGKKKSFERSLENDEIKLNNYPNIQQKNALFLAGHVGDSDMPLVLLGSSLFIHISKEEGFGLALAEAISAKKPIVASNIGVYQEIVKDQNLLVDPNNPEQIALMIGKQLVDRKTTNLKIGLSWNKVAERTLHFITSK